MSDWEVGDGDIFRPSSDSADSRIALFFLRPGQTGIIMLAMESVTVQLLQGSGMGLIGPATQPAGQAGPVPPEPGILQAVPAGTPLGQVTPVIGAQAQPVAHILVPPPGAAGAPGASKGSFLSQDSFVKQRVEVLRMEVTVVLVT